MKSLCFEVVSMSEVLNGYWIKNHLGSSSKKECFENEGDGIPPLRKGYAEIMILILSALLSLAPPPGVIHHGEEILTAQEMIQILDEASVVFAGEKHDDSFAHQWELFLWMALASDDRSLALEMFETDVQEMLADYLAGDLSLEEFLEGSRPWGNYIEDYHPLVEYASLNGYGVIAANVPRRYAAAVARNGWEGLSGIEGGDAFISVNVDSTNESYRERFMATMEAISSQMQRMPMDPSNMYRAQLLKDAVMASSITGQSCLFVCGSFHSDYRSGIPDQLEPFVTYLTVKIVGEDEPWDANQADFVIVR